MSSKIQFIENRAEISLDLGSATRSGLMNQYAWSLNIYPTISEVRGNLRSELARVAISVSEYPADPAANVFLLCCAISDTFDDFVLGKSYDFSKVGNVLPLARPIIRTFNKAIWARRRFHELRSTRLYNWRKEWQTAIEAFVGDWLVSGKANLSSRIQKLEALLTFPLPRKLLAERIRVPAAFRSQDLTPSDVISLGQSYCDQIKSCAEPILVVGLRTAGSYFTPILAAYLRSRGHREVISLTIRPKKGLSPSEQSALSRWAKAGAIAAIVDEPVNTGSTLRAAVDILLNSGFTRDRVSVLAPTHPTKRDWNTSNEALGVSSVRVVTLDPEQWHKKTLLRPDLVEARLQRHLLNARCRSAVLINSPENEKHNRTIEATSEECFHSRLKQVYEFRLEDVSGRSRTLRVLAKSVGWGWLSYHALIAANRLSEFVPRVLALEEGILYSEWSPQTTSPEAALDRYSLIGRIAVYVAARTRSLQLSDKLTPDLSRGNRHKGLTILSGVLSGVYGWKPAAFLKRPRIRRNLARQLCLVPTFIDGKMRPSEWVPSSSDSYLKADFEHHGLGKTELNVTDPAYDLADAILQFQMSRPEEARLLAAYKLNSGDETVEKRLMLHKILAGTRMMNAASDVLKNPAILHLHDTFNRQYVDARRLLTVHTDRYCANRMLTPAAPAWTSPLVVLDVDGVIEKQVLGFPATTPAAIEALSLLHAHGFAAIVNTARTAEEVQEYCETLHLLGGIAEYGSVMYDAMSKRWRPLVNNESLIQMDAVRDVLRAIPGVFIDNAYKYSIRAYTYEGETTVPVRLSAVQTVLATTKANRLAFHQTYIDTAIVARDVDKGRSLIAFLDYIGKPEFSTIAVGDSSADLPMFRAASRSFAPSHISCARAARTIGCTIAGAPYQAGFLEIARRIVHPDGSRCSKCDASRSSEADKDDLLAELLRTADKKPRRLLLEALVDPSMIENFAV